MINMAILFLSVNLRRHLIDTQPAQMQLSLPILTNIRKAQIWVMHTCETMLPIFICSMWSMKLLSMKLHPIIFRVIICCCVWIRLFSVPFSSLLSYLSIGYQTPLMHSLSLANYFLHKPIIFSIHSFRWSSNFFFSVFSSTFPLLSFISSKKHC